MTQPTIQHAVRVLAGRCDGAVKRDDQGFNGRDASFGKSLASISHDDWSEKQLEAAHRMLRTYTTQLAGLGIEYAAIRAPAAERAVQVQLWRERTGRPLGAKVPAANEGRKVVADGVKKRWLLQFPYEPRLVASLKDAGLKAYKDEQTNVWCWPVYADKFHKVYPIVRAAGFEGADVFRDVAVAQAANLIESGAKDTQEEIVLEGGRLRPFQVIGVKYARRVRKILNGDQIGLGKTVETIATVELENAYPFAVIAPAKLKLNWKGDPTKPVEDREGYAKWLPSRWSRVEVLDGLDATPSGRADVYIANYDLLRVEEDEKGNRRLVGLAAKLKKLGLKAIAFDESYAIKNSKSQRGKAAKLLADGVDLRFALNGTPIKNRPVEFTNQLETIGQLGAFGGYMGFAKRYCAATKGTWGWDVSGASNLEELHERLRATCYVRRLKEDVLGELPPLTYTPVQVPLSNEAEYRRAERDFISWLAENEGQDAANRASRAEEITRINGLRQLAARGKIDAAKDWVEPFVEAQEKLVVFAHHVQVQQALADAFKAPQIAGGETAAKAEASKASFVTGNATLLVCSLLAGGIGHTLHARGACSTVALHELPWSWADVEQAAGRVHRQGQTQAVNAYLLLAPGTIDDEMWALVREKKAICEAASDGATRDLAASASVEDELLARYKARATKRVAAA